jgi:hypothetical protein
MSPYLPTFPALPQPWTPSPRAPTLRDIPSSKVTTRKQRYRHSFDMVAHRAIRAPHAHSPHQRPSQTGCPPVPLAASRQMARTRTAHQSSDLARSSAWAARLRAQQVKTQRKAVTLSRARRQYRTIPPARTSIPTTATTTPLHISLRSLPPIPRHTQLYVLPSSVRSPASSSHAACQMARYVSATPSPAIP